MTLFVAALYVSVSAPVWAAPKTATPKAPVEKEEENVKTEKKQEGKELEDNKAWLIL